MGSNSKEGFIIALIIFACIAGIFKLGYSFGETDGNTKGYIKGLEESKRIECEVNYSGTRYEMIPGRCIQYFLPENIDKDGFAH